MSEINPISSNDRTFTAHDLYINVKQSV